MSMLKNLVENRIKSGMAATNAQKEQLVLWRKYWGEILKQDRELEAAYNRHFDALQLCHETDAEVYRLSQIRAEKIK